MNILVLEDRGIVSYYLQEFLEDKGHQIYHAFNINDANSYLVEHEDDIGCIITDLNMSSVGLTDIEINQTHAGLFSGWIWLREYVFNKYPKMKLRTIIYSDYLEDLQKFVSASELAGINLVRKRGTKASEQILMYVGLMSQF
jgi:hypothetical protein